MDTLFTWLHESNVWLLALLLGAGLWSVSEIGFRIGRRVLGEERASDVTRYGVLHGAVLTFLALLLTFTMSMAEARYESRAQIVLNEASAIETLYLRTRSSGDRPDAEIMATPRDYVDGVRIYARTEERERETAHPRRRPPRRAMATRQPDRAQGPERRRGRAAHLRPERRVRAPRAGDDLLRASRPREHPHRAARLFGPRRRVHGLSSRHERTSNTRGHAPVRPHGDDDLVRDRQPQSSPRGARPRGVRDARRAAGEHALTAVPPSRKSIPRRGSTARSALSIRRGKKPGELDGEEPRLFPRASRSFPVLLASALARRRRHRAATKASTARMPAATDSLTKSCSGETRRARRATWRRAP